VPDPELRFRLVVGVGALVLAVGAGAWWSLRSSEPVPIEVEAPPATPTAASITVHVAGAVAMPGLVSVDDEARIADAVAAAGGAVVTADLGELNLAAPLRDGDRIDVPYRGEAVSEKAADGGVDLNRATAGELENLPGVGPVLAERIVLHRELYGPFNTVEDLLDVSGIGEAKLAQIREAVVAP
jgi:competence protein ComEA